jgi:hypothetical protein
MQVFLRYITSSFLRDKCNAAAFGFASRLVKWGFSWTPTIYYPLLDLSAANIISAPRRSEENGIKALALQERGKPRFVSTQDANICPWEHDIYLELVHACSVSDNLREPEKVTVWHLSCRLLS